MFPRFWPHSLDLVRVRAMGAVVCPPERGMHGTTSPLEEAVRQRALQMEGDRTVPLLAWSALHARSHREGTGRNGGVTETNWPSPNGNPKANPNASEGRHTPDQSWKQGYSIFRMRFCDKGLSSAPPRRSLRQAPHAEWGSPRAHHVLRDLRCLAWSGCQAIA